MKSNQSILIYILLLALFVYLLSTIGLIKFSSLEILSYLFLVYGITAVYLTLGTHRKGYLFFNTFIFLTGVILYILNNYKFPDTRVIVYPSSLFMIGTGFLILYFDDIHNKIFLYSSVVLILFSVVTIWLSNKFGIIKLANTMGTIILDYSPVFIILIGINILLNRKK